MISRTRVPRASAATARPAAGHGGDSTAPWQRSLAAAVRSLGELLDLLELAPDAVEGADGAARDFPLRVPRGFVARMRRGDPHDPLLRQVLPSAEELDAVPGFGRDPLDERGASPAPGLLHKYRGRALLLAAGACGVHCRYCFRRHFPYTEHRPGALRAALRYLEAREDVHEVILSGGDPLAATDDRLAELSAALEAIGHLRRLRIHTRMPVVLPERVDARLLAWLAASRLRPVMVLHANHPREIDGAVGAAVRRLRDAGVTVLNQSVLLAGVNDRVETLRRLSERLFEAGVLPYYLHVVDRVEGAAHFEVDEKTAGRLIWDLMQQLPGYLVPRLVREQPGAPAKLPIPPCGG